MNSTTIDYSAFDGPLRLLRPATLTKLSHLLNPTKVLLSDDGHLRLVNAPGGGDWRGLADLFECNMLTIQNFERLPNPFMALVSYINQKNDVPVYRLIQFLESMDRFDVIDDTIALMENDLHVALTQSAPADIQKEFPQMATIGDLEHLNETGTLLQYDAFVLYAPEDQAFVDCIVEKMEGEYGLKLCLKDRDLMAGLPFEHKAVTELISNRCRFVLPIFSPHFVNSEDNKFVVNFAEALGIERGCRKIVPCIYEPCNLPKTMCYYTKLDYTRKNQHWDFWDKMRKSLIDSTAQSNGVKEVRKTSMSSSLVEPKAAYSSAAVAVEEVQQPARLPIARSATTASPSHTQPSAISLDPLGSKVEPPTERKHWLKKMMKKSKKKDSDKQKVKATA